MNEARATRNPLLASAEIITVGLPFCVFKILTGIALLDVGSTRLVGHGLFVLGTIDLGFNVLNLGSLVVRRRRAGAVCLIDFVHRRVSRSPELDDLGIALDVFLSFALVALVIGAGMLRRLPAAALPIWNVAVVLNVLGAGIGRLLSSLQQRGARS